MQKAGRRRGWRRSSGLFVAGFSRSLGARAPSSAGARRRRPPVTRPDRGIEKGRACAGSQAAVVKLASYGAGPVRAASLMNYQSDKGELSLEREDGSLVTGKEAVANLAAHWSEENAREPSNDVLRLDIAFDGKVSEDEARAALADALKAIVSRGGSRNATPRPRFSSSPSRLVRSRRKTANGSAFTPMRNPSIGFPTRSRRRSAATLIFRSPCGRTERTAPSASWPR